MSSSHEQINVFCLPFEDILEVITNKINMLRTYEFFEKFTEDI